MQATTTRLSWRILAAAFVLIAVAGCAGDSDERRTAALGEGEAETLSWRGEWTAEAEYQSGEVVTHEGATFVAVAPTTQPPNATCEVDCAWTVMAETGAAMSQTPAPVESHKHDAIYWRTGYDGPVELPEPTQQAVDDWLAGISRWVIRHWTDGGTAIGQNPIGEAGNYLVFARGVYVSVPGLGKQTIPQGASPPLAPLVSGGWANSAFKNAMPRVFPALNNRPLAGPGLSEYSVMCTLRANDTLLDDMSMTLSERGTATLSLMGFASAAADTKFSVGCAHNGEKAGPFVRDLYVVAFRYD